MTFSVYTLGCKVNSCESAAITAGFIAAGFTSAPEEQQADICVINSCAVTSMSVKKARQHISRCKKDKPECIVVLCGCFPQAYPEEAHSCGADIITGNASKSEIASLVLKHLESRTRIMAVSPLSREFDESSAATDLDRTRAFIKIEDGCDRFCTYCIIPTARGRVRSRTPQAIMQQALLAAKSGNREVVLTGINLGCYGQELGLTLGDAVKAADADGIERIRLGSLEPEMITPEEIEKLRSVKKLCPHFHLSLQSGCDETLRRMKRRYTCEEYERVVKNLREAFPGCAITTDIMVGFVGESEEEFSQSLQFAEKMAFAKIHVFPYSIRMGTVAAMYTDQVVPQIKSARVKRMTEIGKRLEREFLQQHVGMTVPVLIEKQHSPNYSNGFTPEYIPVRIYGESLERCNTVNVKITAALDDHVAGSLI